MEKGGRRCRDDQCWKRVTGGAFSNTTYPCTPCHSLPTLYLLPSSSSAVHLCTPLNPLPNLLISASPATLLQCCSPLHFLTHFFQCCSPLHPLPPFSTLFSPCIPVTLFQHCSSLRLPSPSSNKAHLCNPLSAPFNPLGKGGEVQRNCLSEHATSLRRQDRCGNMGQSTSIDHCTIQSRTKCFFAKNESQFM